MARTPQGAPPTREPDTKPAEDLSRDDDLLNSILVDQIAQSKGNKLGLHPQQPGFSPKQHNGEEVLEILQKYVIEHGNFQAAEQAFLRWGDIKAHLETKETNVEKGRLIKLLRRYLMIYGPNSRVEIFKTDRYRSVTLHDELGVYATRRIEEGTILDELQGSVVKFPKSWEADLERGRLRDLNDDEETSGGEEESEEDDEGQASVPQRRSERTGRRDFSVLRSSLKNCLQLFLGPARFLNHDCQNNVELYRKDSYVTFKTVRPIAIGEELTTFYGSDYFGRGNRECMCLSCEIAGTGYYKRHPTSRTQAEAVKRAARRAAELSNSTPQGDSDDDDTPASTPRKTRGTTASVADSPAAMSSDESGDEQDPRQLPRELPKRAARNKSKKLDWSRRVVPTQRKLQRKFLESLSMTEDTESISKDSDVLHCATCATKLERYHWLHQQRFEFCERCVRHAMIFLMPWPAHRRADIREYPPEHLVPRGYLPLKISNYVLPTYLPRPKLLVNNTVDLAQQHANERAAALQQLNALPDSREHRQARSRVNDAERNEYLFSQAALRAWTLEEDKRRQKQLQAEARERAKLQRAETKRRMNEGKEKGVGVWARYEVESEQERESRMNKKYQFVTGTRSGRKIRQVSEDEAEIDELARQSLLRERKAEQALTKKQRDWREAHKAKRRGRDEATPSEMAMTEPPTPGPSTGEPAENALASKLLQAGGEEGEEDEDAENERLGAEADGTILNPYEVYDSEDADDDDYVPQHTPARRSVKQEPQPSPTDVVVLEDSDDDVVLLEPPRTTQKGPNSTSRISGSTSKASGSSSKSAAPASKGSISSKGSGSASKSARSSSALVDQPQRRSTSTNGVEADGNNAAGTVRPRRGRPPGSGKHQKRRAMQEAKVGRQSLPSSTRASAPQPRRHSTQAPVATEKAQPDRAPAREVSSPDEASPRDAGGIEDDHEAASAESVEGEIGLAARRPAKRRQYAAEPEPVKRRKRYFFELQPGMNLPTNPILPLGSIDMRSADSVR